VITEATLVGFKSWYKTDAIRFAPITALFGPNSSGKTSLLQWLLMLKQTAESSDRRQVLNFGDERDPVQLGTLQDVIYRHTDGMGLVWRMKWTLPTALKIADPRKKPGTILFSGDRIEFHCLLQQYESRLKVVSMTYYFDGARFVYVENADKAGYRLSAHEAKGFAFRRNKGRKWDLPAPVKCYGFPDQVSSYFQNAGFLAEFQLAFERQMESTYYLGPLREYPKREYVWGGNQPADMGRRGERVIDAILSSRDRGERISRGKGKPRWTVEEYAAYWLKELRLIDSFEVKPVATGSNLYQVHVRTTPQSPEVLITDVGFGISQILPVIVLCYYVPEGSTIILEQPEIHLHPSVQAGLADVFVDAIKVRGVQIVLESHSEHLLRRLQRRIAEQFEGLGPDDIALYFCEYENDQSKLVPLELDEYGNIKNWPKDFFGDEFGEIAAMTLAQAKRRTPA
jgi:hypothetical protein